MNSLQLVTTAEHRRAGGDAVWLRRQVSRGDRVRVRRGVYTSAQEWAAATAEERYGARIQAALRTRRGAVVVCHESAAQLWGIPLLGPWPKPIHLSTGDGRSRTSAYGIRWHTATLSGDDIVEVGGIAVTSLVRTLLDLSRDQNFVNAVTAVDHGTKEQLVTSSGGQYSGASKAALLERLSSEGTHRGSARARRAIEFSDALAGSPGESVSRAQMHLMGFPAPRLQAPVRSPDGHIDYPDFMWGDLVGEFDGKAKYTREEYTSGEAMNVIVWREKQREDRLRAQGFYVVRWMWADAMSRERLRTVLLRAGLRPRTR